ncbi:hydroxylamine reductase [bacterium]|nr:hydroxylamine reductase [bacterium]
MFCYQCEQTANGAGCTSFGICGKDPETAVFQDLLVQVTKGVSQYAHHARRLGASDREIDQFVIEALFTTVTNVNFDPASIEVFIRRGAAVKAGARELYLRACRGKGVQPEALGGPSIWEPAADKSGLVSQGLEAGVESRRRQFGPDVSGLQELILYGLKGMAAYADHARILGSEDPAVYAFFHEALDFLAGNPSDVDSLVSMAMRTGEVNLRVMELLDAANTGAYGHPEPTRVRVTPRAGKCILVSGHDLRDLQALLEQTAGQGIDIYTHGEMLPAHGYPGLKKHPHLAGNYGGAWQDQRREFEEFPGAILMTTNCIQKPKESYQARIFTCGLVQWPGVTHIADRDFGPVIQAALAAPGFKKDEALKEITVGFAHNAVLGVAGKVIELVKAGRIKHFYLVGGCDGAKPGRNYYTELAEKIPSDSLILTLACGKFRFNKLEFGDIEGIPRLLDIGQCNDAYSAIQIALALAKAFGCGVNDLPLSIILSWYEQKAVCILLTLLHLGIKNMRLGPSLPAFIGPNVLKVLVETFNLRPVSTPEKDLAGALA